MRDNRRIWILLSAGLLALLAMVYYFIDPMEVGWMPKCLWKVATGTDCPGCGSQRMAHALMHGDLRGAWQANAYALCMLPLIGCMIWLELSRERHPGLYRKVHAPWLIWTLAASVLAWWVARNLV